MVIATFSSADTSATIRATVNGDAARKVIATRETGRGGHAVSADGSEDEARRARRTGRLRQGRSRRRRRRRLRRRRRGGEA